MTLPANWTTIPMTWELYGHDGDPCRGMVVFTSAQIVTASGDTFVPSPIEARVVNGVMEAVSLPSTDDPDISPTGWLWRVEALVSPAGPAPFQIVVPAAGGPINLASVVPVEGPPAVSAAVLADGALSQIVADVNSATRSALSSVYAKFTLPPHAGAKTGPYDAIRNAYNWKPSNTRKLRLALGRANAGGTANLAFIGDSLTEGRTTAGVMDRRGSWPTRLRDAIGGLGIPVSGDGMVLCGSGTNSTPYDSRITFSGSFDQNLGYARLTSNGAVLTYTTDQACRSFDIWYSKFQGSFEVRIDGVLQTTVNPTGASAWDKVTVTNGVTGSHTVTITRTSSSTAVSIKAINAYSPSGALTHNLGVAGTTVNGAISSTAWTTLEGQHQTICPKASMDALFVSVGINDLNVLGRTPAQAVADIQTWVGMWQPGPDVVLVLETHSQPIAQATWDDFASRLYGLADTLDVPLLDMYHRYGTYTIGSANGMYSDTIHLTSGAYADWGRNAGTLVLS